jgi:hypothetical protein
MGESGRVVNIGMRPRLIRLAVGVLFLAAGVALTAMLAMTDNPRMIRVALLGVFLPGMIGVLQFREKT